jgi:hypothetical protein
MAFLENFYASEFTVGNMNGSESSRADDLAMFSSGDMKPALITDGEMKVTIYGQAAMVTGIEHVEGTYKGHAGQFDLRFTNVFVNRDQSLAAGTSSIDADKQTIEDRQYVSQ